MDIRIRPDYRRPLGMPPGIAFHALQFAGSLQLEPTDGRCLHVVHARGRGTRLQVPAGWLTLCMPLTGCLQFETAETCWELPAGQLQAWRDAPVRVSDHRSGAWLALAGPMAAWHRHLQFSAQVRPEMFPMRCPCSRDLRRLLVMLARSVRAGSAMQRDPARLVEAVCTAVLEQQQDLANRVPLCSGRTLQRRQQTMLRLLRVRHLIETSRGERPDLVRLARSASYSPWHLIRIHRDVFGETPSEYAARLRLLQTWALVQDTSTAICEISEALGFESQSAFCRSFKKSFGCTTTQVRKTQRDGRSLAA
ncbi:helix-turn-helix domain-containing protein [Luteimonas notoginsengisoli]|uniref:Helix-turn-helix domain-containing protein n=1 Tax=Luteimonas notoginsengisoli TaxID=1578200 RepID=A0ABV7US34_9GAMM